jgi:hypothetical protein
MGWKTQQASKTHRDTYKGALGAQLEQVCSACGHEALAQEEGHLQRTQAAGAEHRGVEPQGQGSGAKGTAG